MDYPVLEIVIGVGLAALVALVGWGLSTQFKMEGDFRSLATTVKDMKALLEVQLSHYEDRMRRIEDKIDEL
ncbi:MAG: hypothetical protein GY930_11415 [bacterium]|nr:hypothetical protein [bacterium]